MRGGPTVDAQVFVSHSQKDEPGGAFLKPYFASSHTKAYFYGWEGPQPPHAPALKKAIQSSVGMIVLMSDYLLQNVHTAAWVSYEVGLAHDHGLPVILAEAIPETISGWDNRLPVAHVDYLFYYNPWEKVEKLQSIQEIIDSACQPNAPVGMRPRKWEDSPFIKTLNKHFSQVVNCTSEKCRATFRRQPGSGDYICPVCRTPSFILCPDCQGKGKPNQMVWNGPYRGIPALYGDVNVCLTCKGEGIIRGVQQSDGGVETPIELRVDKTTNGDWMISVVGGDNQNLNDVSLIVKDDTSGAVVVYTKLNSIPKVVGIFNDNNGDNKVSVGDTILLRRDGSVFAGMKVQLMRGENILGTIKGLPA